MLQVLWFWGAAFLFLAVPLFIYSLIKDIFWDFLGVFGVRRPVPAETPEETEGRRMDAEYDRKMASIKAF